MKYKELRESILGVAAEFVGDKSPGIRVDYGGDFGGERAFVDANWVAICFRAFAAARFYQGFNRCSRRTLHANCATCLRRVPTS